MAGDRLRIWPGAVSAGVALGAALVSVAVYRPVLHAYFWKDDFVWLYLLRDRPLTEVLLAPVGGHTPVAANAVFALLDALAGLDPRPYFALALATHALDVLLLHRLLRRLTASVALAGLGALAWGACPTAAETLSWYCVYAQIAATTCLLVALDRVVARAAASDLPAPHDLVFVGTWLGLASLFFGTAIPVTMLLPVVVGLLFPRTVTDRRALRGTLVVSATVLGLYVGLQILASATHAAPPVPLDALRWFAHRTLPALAAFAQLVRVGVASLVLGAWWQPADRSDAVSWITLVLCSTGGIGALRAVTPEIRARMLAFAALALGIYGLIAVARGPMADFLLHMTSAQVGATLRYHYTAQALLVAALCAGLGGLTPPARAALAGAWVGCLLAGLLHHGVAIDPHLASRSEIARALDGLHARIAAAAPGETVYLEDTPISAFGWMPNTPIQLPGLAALVVIAFPTDQIDGRRVRFVERDPDVYRRFTARADSRLARLLVPAPPPGGNDWDHGGQRPPAVQAKFKESKVTL